MNERDTRLELIRRNLDGTATMDEAKALEALIIHDQGLRREYLRYAHLDAALAGNHRPEVPQMIVGHTSRPSKAMTAGSSRWLQWRPLTAAAAGLVLGMLCTSVVWAYAVPRTKMEKQRIVPLFTESFEDPKRVPQRGFPLQAGAWTGDLSRGITAQADVRPKDGDRMVRLVPPASRNFTFAARIVDLSDYPQTSNEESRQVEVTASFHGVDAGIGQRHQIRLAAFSEEPGAVKAIWNGPNMFGHVRQHVGRTIPMKPEDHGWKTLKATMEIPPEARSLVLWLAAGVADESTPIGVHYLDAVHAQFVINDAIL